MKTLDKSRIEKKYLVTHADDLGLQYCFNEGILKACREGILKSACLRAGGFALQDALERVLPACPELGVGIHLCLNEGKSVAAPEKLAHLCYPDGRFRHRQAKGFAFLSIQGRNSILREEVQQELRAQMESLLKHVTLDHVNSHQHIHLIPWLFDIVLELAEYYGIRFVRIPAEPLLLSPLGSHIPRAAVWLHYLNLRHWCRQARSRINKLLFPLANDTFWGLLHTGCMSQEICQAYLNSQNEARLTEMLIHPGVPNHKLDTEYVDPAIDNYCNNPYRSVELSALVAPETRSLVIAKEYTLINYREMPNEKTIDGE